MGMGGLGSRLYFTALLCRVSVSTPQGFFAMHFFYSSKPSGKLGMRVVENMAVVSNTYCTSVLHL